MKTYLDDNELGVTIIGRGVSWLDTGTPDSLLDAGHLIATTQKRQGLMIGCIHEIALRKGFISKERFNQVVESLPKGPYRNYLIRVMEEA